MTEKEEEQKPLTTRQIIRIIRKEIIANRNETTALRAEIAVMRTEISGIQKVLTDSYIQFSLIAASLKGICDELTKSNEVLRKDFEQYRELNRQFNKDEEAELQTIKCAQITFDGKKFVNCILSRNHNGDHFYKCSSENCPGYNWVHTNENPHPRNTCDTISEELKQSLVDEIKQNR